MKILAWDIETRPLQAYRWRLYDQSPVTLPMLIEPGGVICFAARWVGEPKSAIRAYSYHYDGHEEMVRAAYDLLDEADALLSWNGKGFDTKKMSTEFVRFGLTPPSPVREIDMLLDVRRRFGFESNKLEFVAQALLGKGKISHEGFGLWLKCLAGDDKAWNRMLRYNRQDVHLLIELYYRLLPWLETPNARLYDAQECTKPGCDGSLHREGFRTTKIGRYPRFKCGACGAWSTGSKAEDRTDIS